MIQEIVTNVIKNIDQEFLNKVSSDRSQTFILDSYKNLNIEFTTQSIALKYLIDSYNLVLKSSKSTDNKNQDLLKNIYQESRFQILRNIILILNGFYQNDSYSLTESQLVPFLIANYVSLDLIQQLICESSKTRSKLLDYSDKIKNDFYSVNFN